MDDTKLRFGVGVLVLSAVGVGVILTFLFGAFPAVLASTYNLTVYMESAAGVSPNTPVLRDGVRIGEVSNIELKPEGGVLLTLAIDDERKLTRNYVPRTIVGSFITGDAKIEFQKDREAALESLDGQAPLGQEPVAKNGLWDAPEEMLVSTYYSDGDYIDAGTQPSNDLIEAITKLSNLEEDFRETLGSIQSAGNSVQSAGASVSELANSMQAIVSDNEGSVRNLTTQAATSLNEFQLAMTDIREVLNDPERLARLDETLERLPRLLDVTEETIVATKREIELAGTSARRTFDRAGQTFDSLNRTIENVEKFTEPLGERGDELVEQVLVSLANLDNALVQVSTFGQMINNSDGTLRKLIEDDEMYYQIKRTIGNVENASVRIRPILDDVRVFTDKLARDPRELGVRGALSSRPSGMGVK